MGRKAVGRADLVGVGICANLILELSPLCSFQSILRAHLSTKLSLVNVLDVVASARQANVLTAVPGLYTSKRVQYYNVCREDRDIAERGLWQRSACSLMSSKMI